VLLPKCQKATKIQHYRPIYLLNVSFKIFTKVATNRLMAAAQKVINPTQTVILHETLHEMHRKNKMESYLKLILKRHMIKLNGLLLSKMKGFSQTWCKWVEAFT
jgi:hypothetical protein